MKKSRVIKGDKTNNPNKLCSSCRRTCKQVANAVVARCPRYYPISRAPGRKLKESNWKQMELFS